MLLVARGKVGLGLAAHRDKRACLPGGSWALAGIAGPNKSVKGTHCLLAVSEVWFFIKVRRFHLSPVGGTALATTMEATEVRRKSKSLPNRASLSIFPRGTDRQIIISQLAALAKPEECREHFFIACIEVTTL